ncbi:MAG: hypothetical protein GY820_14510 [Gammaproteobacteria bacterium]|nr:hypothetical protein [Gammaproteobacteria bacterium]
MPFYYVLSSLFITEGSKCSLLVNEVAHSIESKLSLVQNFYRFAIGKVVITWSTNAKVSFKILGPLITEASRFTGPMLPVNDTQEVKFRALR